MLFEKIGEDGMIVATIICVFNLIGLLFLNYLGWWFLFPLVIAGEVIFLLDRGKRNPKKWGVLEFTIGKKIQSLFESFFVITPLYFLTIYNDRWIPGLIREAPTIAWGLLVFFGVVGLVALYVIVNSIKYRGERYVKKPKKRVTKKKKPKRAQGGKGK